MDYSTDWNCAKCGRKLRAFCKPEAVRGPFFFTDQEVVCPDCKQPESLIPKPWRVDTRDGSTWITAWAEKGNDSVTAQAAQ
jgi:hypothetical protein